MERLFKPLIAEIEGMGGQILGGRRVQQVQTQGKAQGARLVSFACLLAHSVTHSPTISFHTGNEVLFVFAAKAIAACSDAIGSETHDKLLQHILICVYLMYICMYLHTSDMRIAVP